MKWSRLGRGDVVHTARRESEKVRNDGEKVYEHSPRHKASGSAGPEGVTSV